MSTRRTSRGAQVGPPLWSEAFPRILGELQAPVKLGAGLELAGCRPPEQRVTTKLLPPAPVEALHMAAANGHCEVMQILLDHGAVSGASSCAATWGAVLCGAAGWGSVGWGAMQCGAVQWGVLLRSVVSVELVGSSM